MTEDQIAWSSAVDIAARVKSKDWSPVEITEAVLSRIDRLNPDINAFEVVLHDQAMDEARQAERMQQKGDHSKALLGVPITVKAGSIGGIPTTCGSLAIDPFIPENDSTAVERLRNAGAIVIGSTTTSEFYWSAISRNSKHGITHNPWKTGYNAGASSAGAAAAAAAGFGPLHDGSDGQGSIRLPAHFCGVVGMKPTYGRVPIVPTPNVDQHAYLGPLTRTVADAAWMLEITAGPHWADQLSLESAPDAYVKRLNEAPAKPRIAFSMDLGRARVDDDVAACVSRAIQRISSDANIAIEPSTFDLGPGAERLGRLFLAAHMSTDGPLLQDHRDEMEPALVACIEEGLTLSALDYLNARAEKYELCHNIHRYFQDWDFLLTPTASVAAFPATRLRPEGWPDDHPWDWLAWAQFSYPFNFSGNPAITVPCGFTEQGLPVGLQIVGRRSDDLGILQMARVIEQIIPWAHKRPPLS